MNDNWSLGEDCSWHLLWRCQAGGKVQPRSPAVPWSVLITSVEGGNSSSVCFVALIELSGSSSLPERVLVNFQGSWPRKLYSTIKCWSSSLLQTHTSIRLELACVDLWILAGVERTSCWLNCTRHHSLAVISCSFQSVFSIPECLIFISLSVCFVMSLIISFLQFFVISNKKTSYFGTMTLSDF